MSEPSSFYAKITITPENYEKFLTSSPAATMSQTGWMEWWNSKMMHDKAELTDKYLTTYKYQSIQEIITHWLKIDESYTFSEYCPENQTWHFGIIWFTKNYADMIPVLGTIRGVADFKEANESDFIIVYSYFWDRSQINAYLKFNSKGSEFIEKPCPEDLQYADLFLTRKWHKFAENIMLD